MEENKMTAQAALQELVEVEMALTSAPDEFDERAAELRKKRRNILAFLGMPDAQTARRKRKDEADMIIASKEENALIFYVKFPDPKRDIIEAFEYLKKGL